MKRATVIGNVGGGKSTLCHELAKAYGLPIRSVDKLQWKPGWKQAPPEELETEIREIIVQDKWILDGWGPWETIEERCGRSDTIIIIDHKIWIHYWWTLKRQFNAFFRSSRVNAPKGCDYRKVTMELLKMIWLIHKKHRPRLIELIDRYKESSDVHHIRSPKQLRQFIAQHR